MNANAALSVMKCKLLSAQTLIDVLNVMCAKMDGNWILFPSVKLQVHAVAERFASISATRA